MIARGTSGDREPSSKPVDLLSADRLETPSDFRDKSDDPNRGDLSPTDPFLLRALIGTAGFVTPRERRTNAFAGRRHQRSGPVLREVTGRGAEETHAEALLCPAPRRGKLRQKSLKRMAQKGGCLYL